jgi:hypothetical protein
MLELVLLILFGAVLRATAARPFRPRQQPAPDPLCANCSFAHIQQAANGRRAISCTYGGDVRPIAIDVLYCTDYRNRHARPPVKIVGFVRPIVEDQSLVEAAAAEGPAVG